MQIYNSLTRKKEEFQPLSAPQVTIYSCGVTVYDVCHIGHARSLYIFDVIRRYLRYKGYNVRFVRNITDIEDKIIKRAKELGISARELADKCIESYYQDMALLNIQKGDFEPRATENIPEMISHIDGLVKKGYAYATDTGVYFSVKKFPGYGKLSGQNSEQMLSGIRKEPDETKQDPLDFALWKVSKPDEPSWDSPWGKGRPGWHIECSVMSAKYLNTQTLDIHAGGRDLIFPHHENEIAQSEALNDKPFAKYWLHHGLLTINGQKMAKSLGNFVTVKDVMNKYPEGVLKLFFLQTHYSQPLDFSREKIEERRNSLDRIITFLKIVERREKAKGPAACTDLKKKISVDGLSCEIEKCRLDFIKAMDDDFNTPNAVANLFEIIRISNKISNDIAYTEEYFPVLQKAKNIILESGDLLGLFFIEGSLTMPQKKIEMYIKLRDSLRKEKKYKEADDIRRELEEKGIILEDLSDGRTIPKPKT